MARHVSDLGNFKSLIDTSDIKDGKNISQLFDKSSVSKEFDTKQQLLELCVHGADVSAQVRPFEVAREWTYLLFDEFFRQGDLEKEMGLPVSFLCDRETTVVPKTQPGFLNFIVLPLFKTLAQLMPNFQEMCKCGNQNVETWTTYEETEADKKVYQITKKQKIVKNSRFRDNDSSEESPFEPENVEITPKE